MNYTAIFIRIARQIRNPDRFLLALEPNLHDPEQVHRWDGTGEIRGLDARGQKVSIVFRSRPTDSFERITRDDDGIESPQHIAPPNFLSAYNDVHVFVSMDDDKPFIEIKYRAGLETPKLRAFFGVIHINIKDLSVTFRKVVEHSSRPLDFADLPPVGHYDPNHDLYVPEEHQIFPSRSQYRWFPGYVPRGYKLKIGQPAWFIDNHAVVTGKVKAFIGLKQSAVSVDHANRSTVTVIDKWKLSDREPKFRFGDMVEIDEQTRALLTNAPWGGRVTKIVTYGEDSGWGYYLDEFRPPIAERALKKQSAPDQPDGDSSDIVIA